MKEMIHITILMHHGRQEQKNITVTLREIVHLFVRALFMSITVQISLYIVPSITHVLYMHYQAIIPCKILQFMLNNHHNLFIIAVNLLALVDFQMFMCHKMVQRKSFVIIIIPANQ